MDEFIQAVIDGLLEHRYIVALFDQETSTVCYVTLYEMDGDQLFGITSYPQKATRLTLERAKVHFDMFKTGRPRMKYGLLLECAPDGWHMVDQWNEDEA